MAQVKVYLKHHIFSQTFKLCNSVAIAIVVSSLLALKSIETNVFS